MRLVRRWLPIGLTAALSAVAAPSVAQGPSRGDISAGYQAAGLAGEGGEIMNKGWYVDGAVRLNSWLDLAVDVGGVYKHRTVEGPDDVTASGRIAFSNHQFLGGVRVNGARESRLSPFGRLLMGATRTKAELSTTLVIDGMSPHPMHVTLASTDFAVSIGGGLDGRVTERIGIRTGLDYLWTPAADGGNLWRFGLGAVVAF